MMMKNNLKMNSWFSIRSFRRFSVARGDSGQALVELALVLPVALTFLLGIVEVGRYAYASIAMSSAARAGVQYAAQNEVTASNNTQIIQATQADAPEFPDMTVTSSHYCTCADGSSSTCEPTDCQGSRIIEYVKVQTQYQIPQLFGYLAFTKKLTATGEDIMRVSQ